jgi:hypothetical protein
MKWKKITESDAILAKTEVYQELEEISDMIWIAKLTLCWGDFHNPLLSDDIMP